MKQFKNGSMITVKCCDCSLCHDWTFKVIRGKSPEDDVVEMGIFLNLSKTEELRKAEREGKK